MNLRQQHPYHDQFTHTQVKPIQSSLWNQWNTTTNPPEFPTGKGCTSMPAEGWEDILVVSNNPLCMASFRVRSSTKGGAGTATAIQESSEGLTQDWTLFIGSPDDDFDHHSVSILAITQADIYCTSLAQSSVSIIAFHSGCNSQWRCFTRDTIQVKKKG